MAAVPVDLFPLTGLMDTRSSPDALGAERFRFVQNLEITAKERVRRMAGWEKYLSTDLPQYNNQDLHDQLTAIANTGSVREPILNIYEARSESGYTKLIAATKHRVYALNSSRGNFKIVRDTWVDGVSVAGTCRDYGWTFGQVNESLFMADGANKLRFWNIDQGALQDDDEASSPIPDLDTLDVTAPRLVIGFKGILFILNVVQTGQRFPGRIIWSDVGRPLALIPNAGVSAANQADLRSGNVPHVILAVTEKNDSFYVYTTTAIWEVFLTGNTDNPIGFTRRYHHHTGDRCLAYPKGIITTGVEDYYAGRDGIYRFSPYDPTPERVEWMHRSSNLLFDTIDKTACDALIAGYDAPRKAVWFSWKPPGESCQTKSLCYNVEYRHSSFVDAGFSAFGSANITTLKTMRDWAIEYCICSPEDINAQFGDAKEGGTCIPEIYPECPDGYVTNIYTNVAKVVDGATVEDYDQAEPEPTSLVARLQQMTLADFCGPEAGACEGDQLFIGAWTEDNALKRFGNIYSRERSTSTAPCGTYDYDGYKTIIRSGPLAFNTPAYVKTLHRLEAEIETEEELTPPNVDLRVGAAAQAADPNTDRCNLLWYDQPAKKLGCLSTKTAEEHRRDNTRPAVSYEWPLFVEGRQLYWELSVDGTGGVASFSRINFQVEQKKER